MSKSAAENDLLFGLLALQVGLIDQGQLVAAFQAWTRDKARALADHLVARGDLEADDRSAVEGLVARHLKKHGGDVGRSLAAMPAGRSTRESLARIGATADGIDGKRRPLKRLPKDLRHPGFVFDHQETHTPSSNSGPRPSTASLRQL